MKVYENDLVVVEKNAFILKTFVGDFSTQNNLIGKMFVGMNYSPIISLEYKGETYQVIFNWGSLIDYSEKMLEKIKELTCCEQINS